MAKDAIARKVNVKKSIVNALMLVFHVEHRANAKIALTAIAKTIK